MEFINAVSIISTASITLMPPPVRLPTPALQQNVAGCFVVVFVIDVITRQLNGANAESRARRIALLMISRARSRTACHGYQKESDDVRTGTSTGSQTRFDHRSDQRSTLCGAPVKTESRSSVSSTDISTKSKPQLLPAPAAPARRDLSPALFHKS